MSNFLHVDINAYFATLLQQENPYLREKPIAVVKELHRSCVIAASKEAKKLGVKTGCTRQEAKERIPHIIFVPAAFPLYLHATKVLQKIFISLSPEVEVFSLDEAFLDVRECKSLYPDLHVFGRRIQQRIQEELGAWVTCNVGIGKTRFLAKLAGEIAPKGSVFEITPQNGLEVFSRATFDNVCGIGYRLEKKLKAIGVTNLLLLQMCSQEELQRQVGPFWASELVHMVSGYETHQLAGIDQHADMKSVGRSITGYSLEHNPQKVLQTLYNLVEEATFKAREMGLAGRQIWVGLWGGVHTYSAKVASPSRSIVQDLFWQAHQTFLTPLSSAKDMFAVVKKLCATQPKFFPVIKCGIRLSLLQQQNRTPPPLFLVEQKQILIQQAIDKVNKKHGLFTVRSGFLLDSNLIRPEVTGFLGDKKYQLDIVQ